MSSDFEWRVEYETLPPEEPGRRSADPDGDPGRHRRLPRWFLPLLVLTLIISAMVGLLWKIGGGEDPIPDLNPLRSSLQAAVELELNALASADPEILEQLQDIPVRRSNYQPDPERWFAQVGNTAGDAVLRSVKVLDESSASAEVTLTWNATPYHLTWFYRRNADRWVHTDWVSTDHGAQQVLRTSHLEIRYNAADEEQAVALAAATERFITQLCDLLPCNTDVRPFRVELDPTETNYAAELRASGSAAEDQTSSFRLPSPLRIRWPADKQPEPLVLASLARQIAYDLVVLPALEPLPEQNRAALALSTIWLVHKMLGMPSLPSTQWLDEAAARDGVGAVANMMSALRDNTPVYEAIEGAFSPLTLDRMLQIPDYFGWLSLVLDPPDRLGVRAGSLESAPAVWNRSFLSFVDRTADPWQPPAEIYQNSAPAVAAVRFLDDWAIAYLQPDSNLGSVYFFRQSDGVWLPAAIDESLIGEQRSASSNHLTIVYLAWDEPFIEELLRRMEETYRQVATHFDITDAGHFSIGIMSPRQSLPDQPINVDFVISSPNLPSPLSADSPYLEATLALASTMLSRHFEALEMPTDRILFFYGFWFWQMEELGYDTRTWLPIALETQTDPPWQPPSTVDSEEWGSLSGMWPQSIEQVSETKILTYMLYQPLVARYLVEIRGVEAIPEIIGQLQSAESLDSWLLAVTGQSLAEFEPAWRQWVVEQSRSVQP